MGARINITARTGWHVDRLVPALDRALEGWETRVSTGALNGFLGRLVAEHRTRCAGQAAKILFGTQATAGAADLHPLHQRQAGRVVRAVHRAPAAREFGFVGTPIVTPAATRGSAGGDRRR